MKKAASALVATLALVTMAPSSAQAVAPRSERVTVASGAIAPCATEDSLGCYWDARDRGNGHGTSFYVDTIGHVHSGKWTPVPTRMAREIGHGACVWRIGPTSYIRCADGYRTTS